VCVCVCVCGVGGHGGAWVDTREDGNRRLYVGCKVRRGESKKKRGGGGGETIVFGEIRKNVLVRFDGFHLHTRTHTHTQKDVFVNSDSVYLLEIDTEKKSVP